MMQSTEPEGMSRQLRSTQRQGGLVSMRVQMYEKPMTGERQTLINHRPQDSVHASNARPPSRPRSNSRTRATSRRRASSRCRASRFVSENPKPTIRAETDSVDTPTKQKPPKMVVQDIRQEHVDAILNGSDPWQPTEGRDDEVAAFRATPVRHNRGSDTIHAFEPFGDEPNDVSAGFEKIPRAISPVVFQEDRRQHTASPQPTRKPSNQDTDKNSSNDDFAFHTLANDAAGQQAPVAPRKNSTQRATPTETVRPQPSKSPKSPSSATTRQDSTSFALIESGVQYYGDGEFNKALKAFNSALKTQRLNSKKDDIHVALTLSNLGSVYLQQNNLLEAETVLLESLELKRRLAPQMVVADTLNNLGNCMNLRGELEASLIYYEDALDDSRTKKGKPYDEINALFNIGRLEIQRQHWTKAMMALNEACGMAKEVHGTNHAFVAQTLDLMGFAQLSTSKFDAAMVSFTGALAIYRRLHGPMHFEVANSLFNVGMVREAKGELNDSWEAYTTARDLYSRIGTPSDHPGFAAVRRSINTIEKAMQARERSAAKKSRKVKKPDHGYPVDAVEV